MPRNREFDPQKALDKAMRLFWEKGYADTSMRDLVEHTGVAHAGLYSAFGSKDALYAAAQHHYSNTVMNYMLGDLEQDGADMGTIHAFFERYLSAAQTNRNGCLMVNTAVELHTLEDTVIKQNVADHMKRLFNAFKAALDDRPDADETSDFLVTVFNGINVMVRANTDYRSIQNTVKIALKGIS